MPWAKNERHACEKRGSDVFFRRFVRLADQSAPTTATTTTATTTTTVPTTTTATTSTTATAPARVAWTLLSLAGAGEHAERRRDLSSNRVENLDEFTLKQKKTKTK
jgi:hypothetical protein